MGKWWRPRTKAEAVEWIFAHYKGKYPKYVLRGKEKKVLFGWYESIRERIAKNEERIFESNFHCGGSNGGACVGYVDKNTCEGSKSAIRCERDFQYSLW